MAVAFFSAEKMVQNYNNYLIYANKLLFFLPERRFFAHIVYHLCAVMRLAGAKVQQKKQGRKDFLLCAPISPNFPILLFAVPIRVNQRIVFAYIPQAKMVTA